MDIYAEKDETLAKDPRIIPNLLKLEQTMNPPCDYFKTIQTEIKPLMRRIVTNWMCEICDEQKCEYQVLPLAINYMDRFLCLKPITTSQFQLLAAVCLLLASKVRQSHYLTSDLLIYYADNCVTKKDLLNWEILVLTTLEWLLTAPTSYDFIQHIAERVPWGRENINIIRHALTLNSVCQTDSDFMLVPPSVLGCSCLVAAIRGLNTPSARYALHDVCRLTQCDPVDIELNVRLIETVVSKSIRAKEHPGYDLAAKSQLPQPITPTDVHNVE